MENNDFLLNEQEVYLLAGEVISNICRDLNETIYQEIGGKLSIVWREDESFNASAKILNRLTDPPNHIIFLNYYLVKELYGDVVAYHEFVENIHYHPDILAVLNTISEEPLLPESFIKKDNINNMFMASLTFVFFHELGHLMQQHARIRAVFLGNDSDNLTLDECDVENSILLTGKQAAVSHTTELAADANAIARCIHELMRQFSHESLVGQDDKGKLFLEVVKLFVSGISSLFYRFRGVDSGRIEEVPLGTHPLPLVRLEMNLPRIYEMLSFDVIDKIMGHKLNREEIVRLVSKSAYSGAFFWLVRNADRSQGIPENYLFKGLLESEELRKYVKCIITTWDEIKPMIDLYSLEDLPFSILSFTEQLREGVTS